jgi:ferredoxin
MRIDVDWDRCEAHGICADQAPKVFSLDDEGELTTPSMATTYPTTLPPRHVRRSERVR